MQIKPLRSYRATLIPPGTDASDVETWPTSACCPPSASKHPAAKAQSAPQSTSPATPFCAQSAWRK